MGTDFKVGHLHVPPHDLMLAKEFESLSHVLVVKMADTLLVNVAIYLPTIGQSHCWRVSDHQMDVIRERIFEIHNAFASM